MPPRPEIAHALADRPARMPLPRYFHDTRPRLHRARHGRAAQRRRPGGRPRGRHPDRADLAGRGCRARRRGRGAALLPARSDPARPVGTRGDPPGGADRQRRVPGVGSEKRPGDSPQRRGSGLGRPVPPGAARGTRGDGGDGGRRAGRRSDHHPRVRSRGRRGAAQAARGHGRGGPRPRARGPGGGQLGRARRAPGDHAAAGGAGRAARDDRALARDAVDRPPSGLPAAQRLGNVGRSVRAGGWPDDPGVRPGDLRRGTGGRRPRHRHRRGHVLFPRPGARPPPHERRLRRRLPESVAAEGADRQLPVVARTTLRTRRAGTARTTARTWRARSAGDNLATPACATPRTGWRRGRSS